MTRSRPAGRISPVPGQLPVACMQGGVLERERRLNFLEGGSDAHPSSANGAMQQFWRVYVIGIDHRHPAGF
ncbi:MAG: hypothetical protein ACYDCW_01755 [Acidithiobacillus ferrivorans]